MKIKIFLISLILLTSTIYAKPTAANIGLLKEYIKNNPIKENPNNQLKKIEVTNDGKVIYTYVFDFNKELGIKDTPTKKDKKFAGYILRGVLIKKFKEEMRKNQTLKKQGFEFEIHAKWKGDTDKDKPFLIYKLRENKGK